MNFSFLGFAQSLGRLEADLRQAHLSDDSRSDESPERSFVGGSTQQRTTENVDSLRRHAR
jgi:hypothetical protein